MKKQLIVLFITFLLNSFSQNLDSMLLLANGFTSDTLRSELFYKQGYANRLKNSLFSYQCARYCEAYAKRSGYEYYKAKAATLLGILFYRKGDFQKSMSYHQQALQWRRIINDEAGMAKSELNLANVASELKWYKQAQLAYLRALQLATTLKDNNLSQRIYLNLGVLHQEGNKNYALAEYYYLKALEQAKQFSDYEIQGSALNNLSDLAIEQKQFEKAEAYAEASLIVKDLMDNKPEQADSYLNLSRANLLNNQNSKGSLYLDSALQIIKHYDYEDAKEEYIELKALEAEKMKNFEQANFYNKLLIHVKDSLSKLDNTVEFDENFKAEIPSQEEASYSYFIWICLFLFVPFLIYFFKPTSK